MVCNSEDICSEEQRCYYTLDASRTMEIRRTRTIPSLNCLLPTLTNIEHMEDSIMQPVCVRKRHCTLCLETETQQHFYSPLGTVTSDFPLEKIVASIVSIKEDG